MFSKEQTSNNNNKKRSEEKILIHINTRKHEQRSIKGIQCTEYLCQPPAFFYITGLTEQYIHLKQEQQQQPKNRTETVFYEHILSYITIFPSSFCTLHHTHTHTQTEWQQFLILRIQNERSIRKIDDLKRNEHSISHHPLFLHFWSFIFFGFLIHSLSRALIKDRKH